MSTDGKARIIEAARVVISQKGITGASVRDIAEEAELTTGAIYHHYKDKENVLYEVMDESLSVSSYIANKSHLEIHNNEEIIAEIYENIKKRFEKDAENRLQFYFAHEAMLGNDELKDKFNGKYKEWIDRTIELIHHLYGKKAVKYDRALASLLIGAIDGVVLQLLLNSNQAETDEIAEVYHQFLKEGIPKFIDYLQKL